MGRNNRYKTHVEPYLKEIAEWYQFLNENQIAKRLGISPRSFENYKCEHPELRQALTYGKESLVEELKLTMKKKALGYEYTERKTVIRDEGGRKVKVIEEYLRYAHPDTGAMHLLLKNYDPDNWANDPQMLKLREKELELQERKLEQNEW